MAFQHKNNFDRCYFEAYSDIKVHEDMLGDSVRTMTYKRAILQNYSKIYGKVVLDVGAGTGILSMFCVLAGAKKVYAVEASDMAYQMENVIACNRMENRIEVIHGQLENIELPEMVDVIVSEWMGYCLLYECMLTSVLQARDKWLKPNGIILPNRAELYVSLFSDSSDEYNKQVEFWKNLKSTYKVDLSSMGAYATKCFTSSAHVRDVLPNEVYAHAARLINIDLMSCKSFDCCTFNCEFALQCFGRTKLAGVALWFNVYFEGNIILSTSPYNESTHWLQTVLLFDSPEDAEQGTNYSGCIILSPMKQYQRFLDINCVYSIDNGPKKQKSWKMDANF